MSNEIRIVSRRGFLGNVFSAGALIVGARLPLGAAAPAAKAATSAAWNPNVFLGIDPDGDVLVHGRERRRATCWRELRFYPPDEVGQASERANVPSESNGCASRTSSVNRSASLMWSQICPGVGSSCRPNVPTLRI